MFLFVIHLMMVWLRAETCSEWCVIINTRWNVVAKEVLVILILSSYTQQDAFTQSKNIYCDDLLDWWSDCQLCWSPSLPNGIHSSFPIVTTRLSIYVVHLRLRSASCMSSPFLTPEIRENLSCSALSRSPSLTALEGICGREWKGEKWL
jgi:hypothetical protein